MSNDRSNAACVKRGRPRQKILAEYDFSFPKRIPKAAILRLFDCDFIPRHGNAVFIRPTGTGNDGVVLPLSLPIDSLCGTGLLKKCLTESGTRRVAVDHLGVLGRARSADEGRQCTDGADVR